MSRRRSVNALFRSWWAPKVEITREQRAFLWGKLLGSNDKDAALAAGYAPSVAQNTKQKIWSRPGVRDEYAKLDQKLRERYGQESSEETSMGEQSLPVGIFQGYQVSGARYVQGAIDGWHVRIGEPHQAGQFKDCWVEGKEVFDIRVDYMVRGGARNVLTISNAPKQDLSSEERAAIFEAIKKWEAAESASDDEEGKNPDAAKAATP
jgi:hypothetical protein